MNKNIFSEYTLNELCGELFKLLSEKIENTPFVSIINSQELSKEERKELFYIETRRIIHSREQHLDFESFSKLVLKNMAEDLISKLNNVEGKYTSVLIESDVHPDNVYTNISTSTTCIRLVYVYNIQYMCMELISDICLKRIDERSKER